MTKLDTPRLTLISCTSQILEAALKGNEALAKLLKVKVASNWTEFGHPPLLYTLHKIKAATEAGWWTWFPVLKEENALVGSCGYKGAPTKGSVEIGYEIASSHRNLGLATEIAQALMVNAFAAGNVDTVIAHTLAEKNASARVLEKCGFRWIKEIYDPEDGPIWRWEADKNSQVQ